MSDEFMIRDTPQFDRELPAGGDTLAVCFNVFNLGIQETKFGNKPQAMIYFEIDQRYSGGEYKGKRMLIGTRAYTATLSEKGNLRPQLESWRGKPFTAEQLLGWDIKKVKGAPAIITITHNNGYADITAIKRAMTLGPDGKTFIPIQAFTLETDPAYIPKRVQNLLDKRIVQEHEDTDKIADKGWIQGKPLKGPELTEKVLEIF
jgi:hypothetical protein